MASMGCRIHDIASSSQRCCSGNGAVESLETHAPKNPYWVEPRHRPNVQASSASTIHLHTLFVLDAQAQATRGISPVGSVRTTSPLLMQEQKGTRACGSGRGTRDKVRIPLSVNDLA